MKAESVDDAAAWTDQDLGSAAAAWTHKSMKAEPLDEDLAAAAWTEDDEVRLLEAALEFAMEPAEMFDPSYSPCERLRRPLRGSYSRTDVVEKIKELKWKYEEDRRRSGGGGSAAAMFELSHKIWGGSGGGGGSPVRCYTRKRKRQAAAPIGI